MAITIHETQLEAFAKLSPEEQIKVVEQIESQHGPEVLAQYSALYNQWYANKQAEAEASGDQMGLGEYFGIAAGSTLLKLSLIHI